MKSSPITPRSQDYAQWYVDVCTQAELAEHAPVRGCMIIRPNGFAIWERMQEFLNREIKNTGHRNVYFPMFIPKSYLTREAQHVEGFASECAVVTHHRLKKQGNEMVVDPDAKLEEELVVRPTSETMVWATLQRWIQSYRDLPMLLNQWSNVCRWEMRTRLFLRTSEFLWQEGHTAHATAQEARQEAVQMIGIYRRFVEEELAIPVIVGQKPPWEKFPGAEVTHTIEGLMQDGKALQMGTSHDLGQNFAKAFDVQYQTAQGTREFVHATSWGVTTRLIGALIMTHSDDRGLVLPPRLAEHQVVVVLIYKTDTEQQALLAACQEMMPQWEKQFRVQLDTRWHLSPGVKFADSELKGIPLRLEMGPRDLAAQQCVLVRRDREKGQEGQKTVVPWIQLENTVPQLLEEMQQGLFTTALERQQKHTWDVHNFAELEKIADTQLGFYRCYLSEKVTDVPQLKELGLTVRCVLDTTASEGPCVLTGHKTTQQVLIAKAY